jgi:hypothetical protein
MLIRITSVTEGIVQRRCVEGWINGQWMRTVSPLSPTHCQGCACQLGDLFHLVADKVYCSVCAVGQLFTVEAICELDEDKDLMPTVDKVPFILHAILQHLPSPPEYVRILDKIIDMHLCQHTDDDACNLGHDGEAHCSEGIRKDLFAEQEEFNLYLQLAYLCGNMQTVDGMYTVLRCTAMHFGNDFQLSDINGADGARRVCAADMICCMGDVIRNSDYKVEWLRSSSFYSSQWYVDMVRQHLLPTFH